MKLKINISCEVYIERTAEDFVVFLRHDTLIKRAERVENMRHS